MDKAFEQSLKRINDEITDSFNAIFHEDLVPEAQLVSAMRYAVSGKAKRIRAYLSITTGELLGLAKESSRRIACSIECLHAASLIHDDLPALDDADTRRSQPALHKVYGEDVAIIAGDALIALAFEVLASTHVTKISHIQSSMLLILARAFGVNGVCGGQYLDIRNEINADIAYITRLQRMKTGALMKAAIALPVCLASPTSEVRHALYNYVHDLGLVFQIVDDILDVNGDQDTLGKNTGQDQKLGKTNFISLLGLESAKSRAKILGEQAKRHLDLFGNSAHSLSELVAYVLDRID